jgi:hypothetical protein
LRKHFERKATEMDAVSEAVAEPDIQEAAVPNEEPTPSPKHPGEEAVWTIEEGARKGERLTSREMSEALRERGIDPGTRVMSSKRGLHIAFASPGKRALKLRQYGGQPTPQNIEIR